MICLRMVRAQMAAWMLPLDQRSVGFLGLFVQVHDLGALDGDPVLAEDPGLNRPVVLA